MLLVFHRVWRASLCLGLLTFGASFQGQTPEAQEGPLPTLNRSSADTAPKELDNAAIIRMAGAQVGDSILLQLIRTQPGTYRIAPADLIALKEAGVSEVVISAMVARTSGLAQHVPDRQIDITPLSPEVDDPGLYFKNKQGQWEAVSPELVRYRDGGALKSVLTNNIVKKDLNGQVEGGKSPLKLQTGTEMMILAPRMADSVEYIILRFRTHPDRREFRVKTGNVFHSETGADRDQLAIPIRKVASRIFAFTIPTDLAKGEYGVLPPGNASTPGIVYAGKMYTFSIAD